MTKGLSKAITLADGLSALARLLDTSPQVVWNWRKRGVPAEWCPKIESALDGRVTCHELRPDIFGRATKRVA